MVKALAAVVPGVSSKESARLLGFFGFHVRATGVLMLWPIAAVAVHLLVTASWQRLPSQRRRQASSPAG
jgi:hypothetical protein